LAQGLPENRIALSESVFRQTIPTNQERKQAKPAVHAVFFQFRNKAAK